MGGGFQAVTVASREHVGQATTIELAPSGIRMANTLEQPWQVTCWVAVSNAAVVWGGSNTGFVDGVVIPSGSETPPLLTTV